jgi:inner membrane protease ATP23
MEKVEKWLDKSLLDPMIVFMFQQLEASGCAFKKDDIIITKCPDDRAGGFSPQSGIVLCSNSIINKTHLQDTLAHELVHAYDHCTTTVDFNVPSMLACSEIRAQTLSGECKFTRELFRGHPGIAKHFQTCVKRRSILGVKQVFPDGNVAQDAVNSVWDKCFPDTAPFDEIY